MCIRDRFNVANIITDTYDKGNDVIVVVSAQGDTTDDLIAKAAEINPNPVSYTHLDVYKRQDQWNQTVYQRCVFR